MTNDEKKHFLHQINTRYNDNINRYFFGIEVNEAADILRSNFAKFTIARNSYKIEDRIKEILKLIGFSIESDSKNDCNLEKYLNLDDLNENLSNEENKEKQDKIINNKNYEINESIKNEKLKNKYKMLIKDLKNVYNDYWNIIGKACDNRSYNIRVFDNLEHDCHKCSSRKEANRMFDKIATDINKRLNNNYKNYEINFLNMIEKLNDLKNNIY